MDVIDHIAFASSEVFQGNFLTKFPEIDSQKIQNEPFQIDQRVSLEEWAKALSKFAILSISIGSSQNRNVPFRSPVTEVESRWPQRSNSP